MGLVYILKNYFDNKLLEQKKMSEHSNTFKTITTEEVNDFIFAEFKEFTNKKKPKIFKKNKDVHVDYYNPSIL